MPVIFIENKHNRFEMYKKRRRKVRHLEYKKQKKLKKKLKRKELHEELRGLHILQAMGPPPPPSSAQPREIGSKRAISERRDSNSVTVSPLEGGEDDRRKPKRNFSQRLRVSEKMSAQETENIGF